LSSVIFLLKLLLQQDAHANLSVILTVLDLDDKGQSVEATEGIVCVV